MILKINTNDIKKRFDVFICEYFENKFARTKISKLIELGYVLVNKTNQKSSYKLKLNDEIEILEDKVDEFLNPSQELLPYEYPLDIIYQDEYLAVINKPKDMICHPTKYDREKTLVNALIFNFGKENLSNISSDRLGIVHRLDKNTAGLIIVAKNNFAHENLSNQIKEKIAKRKYKAIALGEFDKKEGIINKPLVHYLKENVKMAIAPENEGQEAITHFKVLEEYKGATLVELELKTGRTHQIRVHLASLNHPVFGDSLYGAKSFLRNEFYNLKTQEQLLQSFFISFYHPKTNNLMEFELKEDKFSKDFIKVLTFLRSKNEH